MAKKERWIHTVSVCQSSCLKVACTLLEGKVNFGSTIHNESVC